MTPVIYPYHADGGARAERSARMERVAARLVRAAEARLCLPAECLGSVAGGEGGGAVVGDRLDDVFAVERVVREAILAAGGALTIQDREAGGPHYPGLQAALVTLGWRSMLGITLPSLPATPAGALVVADHASRQWTADEVRALEELVALVAQGERSAADRVGAGIEVELRAAKEVAEAARAIAERANQAKTDFLSRMSHELRTPLNSVIGFANVLRANRGNRLDEREISYLDRIITNGRHLLTIVGDLLDLSRVEAGKMPVSIALVPLAPLVRTTAAAFEADLAGRPVALVLDLPDEVGRLETDATRLQQVLINLIGNAMKFTDGGTITVRVVTDPETARPLRLEVQDTGIGIPLHRQAAIFRAFEQAERGTPSAQGGTGLGLAISRSLCQLLGFRLGVRSAPGEGATFMVDFEPTSGHPSSCDGDTDANEDG